MNRKERQEIIQTHPGVRRLKVPTACEGWKHRGACKNRAWWRFTALKRKRSPGWEGTRNLCWSHLIHQGVYGDMDEEARTSRWLTRKGF